MATCTADAESLGFTQAADFCQCAYDDIRARSPTTATWRSIWSSQEDPAAVPDEVDRIRTACYVEVEAAGAPAPPTTAET